MKNLRKQNCRPGAAVAAGQTSLPAPWHGCLPGVALCLKAGAQLCPPPPHTPLLWKRILWCSSWISPPALPPLARNAGEAPQPSASDCWAGGLGRDGRGLPPTAEPADSSKSPWPSDHGQRHPRLAAEEELRGLSGTLVARELPGQGCVPSQWALRQTRHLSSPRG